MSIYLPIAEISINIFLLISLGGVIGFLSGMFGLGGGFLMPPMLIFIGIPTNVAVATSANQIVAASVSGTLGHCCLLYTSPSPRDGLLSRMPSSA